MFIKTKNQLQSLNQSKFIVISYIHVIQIKNGKKRILELSFRNMNRIFYNLHTRNGQLLMFQPLPSVKFFCSKKSMNFMADYPSRASINFFKFINFGAN